jgi:hypothetical protein
MFSAPPSRWRALARRGRARKTAPGAGALPVNFGFRVQAKFDFDSSRKGGILIA